jgi:hypothetical protein
MRLASLLVGTAEVHPLQLEIGTSIDLFSNAFLAFRWLDPVSSLRSAHCTTFLT